MQNVRRVFQFVFLALAGILTARNLMGFTKAHLESYCPGGGLESIVFYLKNGAFLCATSGMNLILFLAVLVGTVVMGRAFCSWVCPIGTLMEGLRYAGKQAGLVWEGIWCSPLGHWLGRVRYVLLAVILYYTYTVADLIFRSWCPYYVVLSGQDHELAWWSKWVMLVLGWAALVIPYVWCKVICPLGAVLGIGRLVSPVAPVIDQGKCTSCRACSRQCPQQINVFEEKRVWSTDCTQCLVCLDTCPEQCIHLGVGYGSGGEAARRPPATSLPRRILPVLVVLMMGVGFLFAFRYPLPTMSTTFPAYTSGVSFARTDLVMTGLRCRGTANTLAWILEDEPGIAALDAYVSEARASILYDPQKTDPQKLVARIHAGRLWTNAKTKQEKLLKPFAVEKIDGQP
ncbi:MAG: 4Fe-4S binding protein [Candidatus Riflebacteria bacterium]|nr:4Fe-4S binding protein [Candidatus Riflebacteria bacterium]